MYETDKQTEGVKKINKPFCQVLCRSYIKNCSTIEQIFIKSLPTDKRNATVLQTIKENNELLHILCGDDLLHKQLLKNKWLPPGGRNYVNNFMLEEKVKEPHIRDHLILHEKITEINNLLSSFFTMCPPNSNFYYLQKETLPKIQNCLSKISILFKKYDIIAIRKECCILDSLSSDHSFYGHSLDKSFLVWQKALFKHHFPFLFAKFLKNYGSFVENLLGKILISAGVKVETKYDFFQHFLYHYSELQKLPPSSSIGLKNDKAIKQKIKDFKEHYQKHASFISDFTTYLANCIITTKAISDQDLSIDVIRILLADKIQNKKTKYQQSLETLSFLSGKFASLATKITKAVRSDLKKYLSKKDFEERKGILIDYLKQKLDSYIHTTLILYYVNQIYISSQENEKFTLSLGNEDVSLDARLEGLVQLLSAISNIDKIQMSTPMKEITPDEKKEVTASPQVTSNITQKQNDAFFAPAKPPSPSGKLEKTTSKQSPKEKHLETLIDVLNQKNPRIRKIKNLLDKLYPARQQGTSHRIYTTEEGIISLPIHSGKQAPSLGVKKNILEKVTHSS